MPTLEALLEQLAALEAQHDLDGMRQVRSQIVGEYPDSPEAVEALYKLGLDALFRGRDSEAASDFFTQAGQKKSGYWSDAARTSLGLCHYHRGDLQRALYELRRVALRDTPSAHTVTALTFMEHIFATEGDQEELTRARHERIKQLEKLIAALPANERSERGYFLKALGTARLDADDREGAAVALNEAKDMGPEVLGAQNYAEVIEALRYT